MKSYNQIKDVPVSVFTAIFIIIIFSLYITSAIKTIPCTKDIKSIFLSNFVHIEPYHLLANLFAIYSLARIEIQIGWKKFLGLLLFLLIFNTVIEITIHKLYSKIPCSIGSAEYYLVSWHGNLCIQKS